MRIVVFSSEILFTLFLFILLIFEPCEYKLNLKTITVTQALYVTIHNVCNSIQCVIKRCDEVMKLL